MHPLFSMSMKLRYTQNGEYNYNPIFHSDCENFGPQQLVDGDKTLPETETGGFYESKRDKPCIMIDLGNSYYIKEIRVTGARQETSNMVAYLDVCLLSFCQFLYDLNNSFQIRVDHFFNKQNYPFSNRPLIFTIGVNNLKQTEMIYRSENLLCGQYLILAKNNHDTSRFEAVEVEVMAIKLK